MKKILIIMLLILTAGCTSKPLLTVEQVMVPTLDNGEKLSINSIESAINIGAKRKGWTTKKIQPGMIEANINVRTHMAKITINYSQDNYSINYKDSTNLDYKTSKDKINIHRNYNRWVANLSKEIQGELSIKASDL